MKRIFVCCLLLFHVTDLPRICTHNLLLLRRSRVLVDPMSFSTIIRRFSCHRDQDRAEPLRKLRRRGRIGTDFDLMRDAVREHLSFDEHDNIFHPDLTTVYCERDSGTFEKAPMDDELTDWRDSGLSPPVTTRRRQRLIKKRLTFAQL
jgi:hypothetical protein